MKKQAFTLAEVLITLGVIGVVAAMTLPTLMNIYRQKVVETGAKKAYTTFSQAMQMAIAEHGPSQYWSQNLSASSSKENTYLFAEKYVIPYIKGAELCSIGKDSTKCRASGGYNCTSYKLSNGDHIGICNDTAGYYMITVNLNHVHTTLYFMGDLYHGKLMPRYYQPDLTVDDYVNGYVYNNGSSGNIIVGCTNKENVAYPTHACSALLYQNGWHFPKDFKKLKFTD